MSVCDYKVFDWGIKVMEVILKRYWGDVLNFFDKIKVKIFIFFLF